MKRNAAKLNADSVRHARALVAARFTSASVAAAFGVCPRTVRDVISGRRWSDVAADANPLPLLPLDVAYRLRLRAGAGLADEQRDVVDRYADQIVQKDDDGEREAFATELLSHWMPRRACPTPSTDAAAALTPVRPAKRLTKRQQRMLDDRRAELAVAIDATAEREGRAIDTLRRHSIKRPRQQKEARRYEPAIPTAD